MAGLLIRTVDDEVARGIDTLAGRIGLSRDQFLRRAAGPDRAEDWAAGNARRAEALLADLGGESSWPGVVAHDAWIIDKSRTNASCGLPIPTRLPKNLAGR